MENQFETLKKSILFNLSLSSKELFHSNLLSFLFNYNNSLFCQIIGIENFSFEVRREYKNIDIEIIGDSKKYLIENKVKDIIDDEQIDKIENCFKNNEYNEFYLFSLLGNNLEMLKEKHPLWKEIRYEKIIDVLKKQSYDDAYLGFLINDYCNFMTIIISLLKNEYLNCNKYILHYKNTTVQKFKEIRLHDLFFKYGMSHFISYFRRNNGGNDIQASYMINRAKPTMTFFKQLNGIEYGIETEDTDYRRYIIGNNQAKAFFEKRGWFDKNWRSANGKEYLKYDNTKNSTFWYQNNFRNRNIENISYKELLDFIKNDINSINS